MAKISVIIPIYNVEKYLKECIDSVINQTFSDIEIICVNDSSTDSSLTILEKYAQKDSRIKIINQENKGLSEARNTGLLHSKGDYVFFLDSDDYINNSILEKLFSEAISTNSDIICSDTIVFADDVNNQRVLEATKSLKKYFASKNVFKTKQITIDNISDGFEDFTVVVWGKLFLRKFLKENTITFPNNRLIHEDDCFWLKTLACFPRISTITDIGVYYRIRANSIITSQEKNVNIKEMRAILKDAFRFIKNKYDKKESKKIISKIKLSNTYCTYFAIKLKPFIKFFWGEKNRIVKILGITFYKKHIKRNYLITRILGIKCRKKDLRITLIKKNQKIIKDISIIPNKIIFNNFNGKGYGCNPKYIAQEILKQKLPYELVWLVKDLTKERKNFPEEIKLVQYNTPNAIKEFASAKIWISNQRMPELYENGLYKKTEQYYIQTWHGWTPIKKIEKDIEAQKKWWCKWAKFDSQYIDLLITSSLLDKKRKKDCFYYNKNFLTIGLPRDDIMYFPEKQKNIIRNTICKKYNIPESNGILLYAPTFRDDGSLEAYNIDIKNVEISLTKKFNKNFTTIARLHPNVTNDIEKIPSLKNCINTTSHPDIMELLISADVLIADYSSFTFEFMHLRKPVFLFGTDIDKYSKNRNFYMNIRNLIFPFANSNEELINNITKFNETIYINKIENFIKEVGSYDKGNVSTHIVSIIKEKIDEKYGNRIY